MSGYDSTLTGKRVQDAVEKVESLAAVATSGSYDDLKDTPTIPAEQVNADWNATSGKAQILNKPTIPEAVTVDTALSTTSTNPVQNKAVAAGINAKYTKPSTGIPKTDLATAVRTSLGKADTALQSYTEQYKGTVTSVKINGSTKTPDANGLVDLGTIESEGGSSSGGYPVIVKDSPVTGILMDPNTYYIFICDESRSNFVTIMLIGGAADVTNEYMLEVRIMNKGIPSLSFDDSIIWQEDLVLEAHKTYQISILNNYATYLVFDNA